MIKKANVFEYKDIHVGQKAEFSIVVTEEMVNKFAELTGDFNPLHTDEKYAGQTKFKGKLAHGMLAASFFSTLVGMYCPGEKNLYLSQNLQFKSPLRVNDPIKVAGEITQKVDSLKIISVKTTIYNEKDNSVIISGEAKVMVREDA